MSVRRDRLRGAWWVLGIWMFLGPVPGPSQQDPGFSLHAGREAALLGTGTALSVRGRTLTARMTPPDPASLHVRDIFVLDRFAAGFQDPATDACSDLTLAFSLGLPAVSVASARGSDAWRGALLYTESLLIPPGRAGVHPCGPPD